MVTSNEKARPLAMLMAVGVSYFCWCYQDELMRGGGGMWNGFKSKK